MSEIDLRLLPEFVVEAVEHLDEFESLLMRLVETPDDLVILNEIFRPVHTLKGSAQFIGIAKIAKLAHRLEDLLDVLRAGKKKCTDDIITVLIQARDRIVQLVKELDETQQEESEIDDLIEKLTQYIKISSEDKTIHDKEISAASQDGEGSVLDDDSDDELYSIFLTHQKEQLEKLKSISQGINQQENKLSPLEKCDEILNSLKSSANYMDYKELVEVYSDWIVEIGKARQSAALGEEIALYFMDIYFMDVEDLLPKNEEAERVEKEKKEDGEDETESSKGESDNLEDFEMPSLEELQAAVGMSGSNDEITGFIADSSPGIPFDNEDEEETTTDHALLPDFVVETTEHLDELDDLLLQLNQAPDDLALLNEIFRPVHTIKGSAQFMGITRVAKLSHRLEDLLDLLREGKKECNKEIVGVLMSSGDIIRKLVSELDASKKEITDINDAVNRLSRCIEGDEADSGIGEKAVKRSHDQIVFENHSEDTVQEDYDEELYGIYVTHLKSQLESLKEKQEEFSLSENKALLVDECIEVISNLSSSANYMGYEKVKSIFSSAIDQLNEIQSNSSIPASLVCVDELYPQLKVIFPDISIDDIKGGVSVELDQDETVEDITGSYSTEGDDSNLDEEFLYESLSNALDGSKHQVSKTQYETLNSVFDEIVSSQTKPASQVEAKSNNKNMKEEKSKFKRKSPSERVSEKNSKESKVKRSLRVDSGKIDSLMNQVGELVVDRSYFQQLFSELGQLQQSLKDNTSIDQKEIKAIRTFSYRFGEAISALGRTSNELQEEVMKMRMLPISQIFNRYPRLIHDLTNNTDKKVNLIVRGEDTELDKMIVEEISDPLIHIIRNAVDHGIESMGARHESGKNEEGSLILEAYQESNHIVIEVTDDGKGIDQERIKNKALQKGLYSSDELTRMNSREINQLILTAGFSTAEKITGTSGRGVGMDVVKQNIDKLNGVLEIESKLGFGTRMRLKIPLTLAIIHALMVRVGKEMFTVPLANVDETVRIKGDEISKVEGIEVIYLRGQTLPIFRLSRMFSVKEEKNNKNLSVVIVNRNGQRTGFVVDELMGQEEVVIKPLAEYVQHKSGFSGATIIGDGRISLILDVFELVRMTEKKQELKQRRQIQMLKAKAKRKNNKETRQIID